MFNRNKLKKLLKEKKITQDEAAKKMGVSISKFGRWVASNAKNVPDANELVKIAEMLDTTVLHLLDLEESQQNPPVNKEKLDELNTPWYLRLIDNVLATAQSVNTTEILTALTQLKEGTRILDEVLHKIVEGNVFYGARYGRSYAAEYAAKYATKIAGEIKSMESTPHTSSKS